MTTENEIKPAAPAEGLDGGRCAVDAGFGDAVQENHDKLAKVCDALKYLVELIEAHEIESCQCDGKEEEHCDCLRKAAAKAKRLLPNAKDLTRGKQP